MSKNTTNQDVESTDHEKREQYKLDPLVQHDVEAPTKQEAHVAPTQFLAMCWTFFVVGWCNGSTGPLLPRILTFYGVSWSTSYSIGVAFVIQNQLLVSE
jgi:fucose permease